MIIILEGPDGSGKSTLAKRLSHQTGFKIIPRGRPKSRTEKDRMMELYKILIKNKESCILDRSWFSEMVYGKIMRDKSCISEKEMWDLETLVLENGGGIVVHCTDTTENLWKRCQERGEDYIKNYETLDAINLSYNYIFYNIEHRLPIFQYTIR